MKMASSAIADKNYCEYIFITNIPNSYHTADLRNFFSQSVESKGFDCFHFRHRPAVRKVRQDLVSKEQNQSPKPDDIRESSFANTSLQTTCCLIRVHKSKVDSLVRRYHGKHWIDTEGQTLNQRCIISRIKFSDDIPSPSDTPFIDRSRKLGSQRIPMDQVTFTRADIQDLAELNPPSIMPQGNVGTPTATFLGLIQTCRMPSRLIGKLGLVFPKTKGRRQYSSVPYQYRGTLTHTPNDHGLDSDSDDDVQTLTARGQKISDVSVKPFPMDDSNKEETVEGNEQEEEEEEEEDGASVEEWDRHEAFYDDVTEQDRTKERRFEKEIELQWEKGGSGLVYYTDAQYWDEQKGDFDERTADDWDVDVSGYYEKDGGDMDAKDYIQMRREGRRRDGEEVESAFEKRIGTFEKHTKGIGRKLMEQQGWSEGKGLGKTVQGMSDALENEGKHPRDKRGLGFHGDKRVRFGFKKRVPKEVNILTVYDDPTEVDQPESLLRRNTTTFVTHRQNPEQLFKLGEG